jgi:hypothetical protein
VVFKVTAMWNYFGGILKCHISIISVEFSRDESHNTCLFAQHSTEESSVGKKHGWSFTACSVG